MPDVALSRTERQFMDMLQASARGVPVRLRLYSLPSIPRGDRGRRHLMSPYRPIDDLWRHPPDAIVVSGTEPLARDLRDEPYWRELTALIDWIADSRVPAMFSCLASHAAVLHRDGILRRPLATKCFGLFDHEVLSGHDLTRSAGQRMPLPHTRWNEVDEAALLRGGYQVLSRSTVAGVGFFTKRVGGQWLFCQGHPEYDGASLLREYRRDVLRFLRHERATFPELPQSYLDERKTRLFEAFAQTAMDESAMATFPGNVRPGPSSEAWRPASVAITRDWLKTGAPRAWPDAS